jgi:hypothetical protein
MGDEGMPAHQRPIIQTTRSKRQEVGLLNRGLGLSAISRNRQARAILLIAEG